MKLLRKPLFIYVVVVAAALVSTLTFSVLIVSRILENDSGFCFAENRVLGVEEHRQKFLRDLVQLEINNSSVFEKFSSNQALKVGIIKDSYDLDFRKSLVVFFDNNLSFEENFVINVLAPGGEKDEVGMLKEPFIIVTYDSLQGGGATFTPSHGVVRSSGFEFQRDKYKPTLYERFRGFGNHYYNVTYTYISVECCDNNTHHRAQAEYVRRKKNAYAESLSSIDKGFASHTNVAVASNCGEVLTKESGNGIGAKLVKWIRL